MSDWEHQIGPLRGFDFWILNTRGTSGEDPEVPFIPRSDLSIVTYRATLFFILVFLPVFCRADGIPLPPTFMTKDIISASAVSNNPSRFEIDAGGSLGGFNNIRSIWSLTDKKQSPIIVGSDMPYARLRFGQWERLSNRNWFVAAGSGFRDEYDGNPDAAQLYVDLRTKSRNQDEYSPVANDLHVDARWYGIGRQFDMKVAGADTTTQIMARSIKMTDLLARSLDGSVNNSGFAGNIRILSSDNGERVFGHGWSLDLRTTIKAGQTWEGLVAAEGLLGRVKWKNLSDQNMYIQSTYVFTDPDGFYRDAGGISGIAKKRDLAVDINRNCRFELMRKSKIVNLIGGISWQEGYGSVADFGVAIKKYKSITPYTRIYPAESRIELGAVGKGWHLAFSGDGWLFAAPKNATVDLSAAVRW
ncbi:MAG: hypothetical protein GX139_08390 [Armatimonadetes bacterium]|nr:hypothetical protein [Armatimonadota bacterium]